MICRTIPTVPLLLAPLWILFAGCDSASSGIGAPCNSEADCDEALICDEHDGRGSCQEAHGHDAGDEDGSSTTTSGATTTSGGSTTAATNTAGTGSSSGAETSGTGATMDCAAFCGCLHPQCSEFAEYPHASEADCMTACDAFTPEEFICFSRWCEDVTNATPNLREHSCEHAWGGLGIAEC